MSASASRRLAAFTWWPSIRRPFTTTVPRPSRCACSSASITSSGGREVVGLRRERVVAVGKLERMHEALAVEAQVAPQAARQLEGLHVLQVRRDAVHHRAIVGAAREQHVREAVHERDAVGRAPAVQLVEQVGGRDHQAGDAVRGRRDLHRAQHGERALDHQHDRQVLAAGGVEQRRGPRSRRPSTRCWERGWHRRPMLGDGLHVVAAPGRVEVVHPHDDLAPADSRRRAPPRPRCGATRPSSRPGSGSPRSRITESTRRVRALLR